MIKPAYSFSFLLSINIFVWQNVLYFLDAPRTMLDFNNTDSKVCLSSVNTLFILIICSISIFLNQRTKFSVNFEDEAWLFVSSIQKHRYFSSMGL